MNLNDRVHQRTQNNFRCFLKKTFIAWTMLILFSCTSSDNTIETNGTLLFKAVYISDTQISNDTTKDARLSWFVQYLNEGGIPGVEMLLHGGDLVSSVFDKHPERFPNEARNRLAKAVDILNQLKIPWYATMGNHDYKYWSDRDSDTYFPQEEILQMEGIWKEYTGQSAYYSVQHRGWNFILLNSMRGRYLHRYFDDSQMDFLEKELSRGLPCVIITHYPIKTDHVKIWAKPKDLITPEKEPRFFSLIKGYKKQIHGIFVGHGHMEREDRIFKVIPVYEVDDFAEEKDMPHLILECYEKPIRLNVVKKRIQPEKN